MPDSAFGALGAGFIAPGFIAPWFGGVPHHAEAPGTWHRLLDRIITGGLLGDRTAVNADREGHQVAVAI